MINGATLSSLYIFEWVTNLGSPSIELERSTDPREISGQKYYPLCSGEKQYLLFFLFNLAADLYLSLVCPLCWLWRSWLAGWGGWAQGADKVGKCTGVCREISQRHDRSR